MMLVLQFGLISCKNEEEPQVPQEVTVSLDYAFMESGSMSRAAEDAYNNFYETQIKTKKVCPKNFNLTFLTARGTTAMGSKGTWASNNAVRLLEGSYRVQGESSPKEVINKSQYTIQYACDSVYISFDATLDIVKTNPNITIPAKYNCSLILIPDENVTELKIIGWTDYSWNPKWNDGTTADREMKVGHMNGYYYCFVNYKELLKMVYKTPSGLNTINFGNVKLEKGKYYYFDPVTHSFDLPKMEAGN